MSGHIKTQREIMNHWVWKNPLYFRAWMYILLRANWENNKFLFGKKLMECKRGQFVTSIRKFGEATDMTDRQVRTFWDICKKDHMIDTRNDTLATQITVCNYDSYQGRRAPNDTPNDTPATTNKKYKEVYKEYILKTADKKYHGFVKYLLGDNELGRPFEVCLNLPKDQISYSSFLGLMEKYPKELIKDKIRAMETNAKVAKDGISFSGTLHSWCRIQLQREERK